MGRPAVWLQLLLGWLPVGMLFVLLILSAHRGVHPAEAIEISIRMTLAGALLGWAVNRFARRMPWPEQVGFPFVGLHLLAATTYATAFFVLNSVFASLIAHRLVLNEGGRGAASYVVMGLWLYFTIAGAVYASDATARVAR